MTCFIFLFGLFAQCEFEGAGPGIALQTVPSAQPATIELSELPNAIGQCWLIDPNDPSSSVLVKVAFSLRPDGTPVTETIRLVSASDGSAAAQARAFEAARRAVIRCARGGYALPIEKYDEWREIEITFDPTTMRSR